MRTKVLIMRRLDFGLISNSEVAETSFLDDFGETNIYTDLIDSRRFKFIVF